MSAMYDANGNLLGYAELGCLSYKDKDGILYYMYPVTKKECIEGLEGFDQHLLMVDNPHNVTAEQIGAVTPDYMATPDEVLAYLNIGEDTEDGTESGEPAEDETTEEIPSV